ncbi:hydroxymethylglutaryl-CoA lyase [Biformimicrobium ophioploci]|uniref:Hydroxymethylglutaryl-CoA lyase n=1 Tax=Biformimicrobium ophioploci TaxID=3036711 RepID=A0ABQ6LW27_9GAMM|nr:hydroxymethylglutaryl-CoA lyase [Microbulbifer sp. NKW57]GMG86298.1 hydroxymethylglutaryl-CoA lyase [Microbulbifer sp. NKW57]
MSKVDGKVDGKVDIEISEVGPRDGLQSIATVMPTEDKKRWIAALASAGLQEIEVGSFVPPKLLPQLADTAEIVRYAIGIGGLRVAVLVPNLRGASDALAAGAHKLTIPLSVSETHSLKNLRKTHTQVLEEVRGIRALLDALPPDQRPQLEGSLSTCFGCTLEGPVSEDAVVRLGGQLLDAGCDEIGLSDTTGYGNPVQVRRVLRKVWNALGRDSLNGIHLHNTRGQGLANVLAAVEEGVTTVDASMGGIGGCPFAPGASGNIVTEDLVFLLEAMGYRTGVDFERLLSARAVLAAALPGEPLYGFLPEAGLPRGFELAGERAAEPV